MQDLFKDARAVIFDLDGVIVDTMPFHARAWQETFRKFNINITKKEVYLREGEKWDKTFYDILKKKGFRITKGVKEAVFNHRSNVFKNILKVRLFKGAPGLLKGLKKNFSLALVTGTPRREVRRILPKDIYALFDVIVTSDEVRHGKPHPEPFRRALTKLKIAPHEAVVIENAPNGIRSAKSAGIKVIAVETSLPKRYLKGADLIVGSLSEIRSTSLRASRSNLNPVFARSFGLSGRRRSNL